jgi:AraC-like DNA-binding protein
MTTHIASPSAQSAQWIRTRLLIEHAAALGCSRHTSLQGTRITPEMLEQSEHTITVPDQIRIMINAVRALPDAPLGILWGKSLDVFSRDRMGLWLSANPTFGKLLDTALQLQDLLSVPVRGKGIREKNCYRFELHYPPTTDPSASLVRLHNESLLAGLLITFQQLVEQPLRPAAIHCCHPKPTYHTEYDKFFNCPIQFDQDVTALIFDLADLDLRIPSHNPSTQALYKQQINNEIRQHLEKSSLSAQIKMHLTRLPEQSHTATAIARILGMSERTLRRRLEHEGTTFRDLQHQALTEHASELMKRPGMTVQAAAEQLGYADASNFRRALKRVTGNSPSDLRRT